jgi:branched-chain amino acid transport system ATP-binding protein
MILHAETMSMDFGGLRAVDRVDVEINEGEVVALIGPNGAGKTTFFNCVTGMYVPTEGRVVVQRPGTSEEKVITGMRPNKIAEVGLARTFQNIRLFPNMTVLENVMIGRDCRLNSGILASILRTKKQREEEDRVIHDSYEILRKIGIEQHVNEQAKNLPYGAQRRLEIARALATEPFLLLLDEPAAGMNPRETRALEELILRLRETEQLTIFLIEHDMSMVMSLSERIYVMDYGKLIAHGSPDEIKSNPAVIKAYLGEEVSA